MFRPPRSRSAALVVLAGCAVLAGLWALGGCRSSRGAGNGKVAPANTTLLMPLNLEQPAQPTATPGAIDLAAAKNETVGFALRITGLPAIDGRSSRKLRVATGPDVAASAAWQIMALPVDLNRAGYVRHTGLAIAAPTLPRALLPLKAAAGVIDLAQLRDPNRPTLAGARAGGSGNDTADIWIDLHINPTLAAGQYPARCELLDEADEPVAAVEIKLSIYDFAIPEERHLQMISPIDWDRLVALHREQFETIRPNLLNRTDAAYAPAVKTLDQLVTLAQSHRCQVAIPRLAPRVKWPPGEGPEVEWNDFVSVVQPWLSGEAFADRMPLGFWPIPQPDLLPRFDRGSQLEYWSNAARRFDQNDWLPQSAVLVEVNPGRVGAADAVELSAMASQLLTTHAKLRVALPLEEDQLLLARDGRQTMIPPVAAGRLLCSAPGLVFAPPIQPWDPAVPRPRRWLRTDLPGLVPYLNAEHDVQTYAWLAYLREADLILWPGSLPLTDNPSELANPNDPVWFYPGHWFGIDQPVPTLQLKWLRRAQQDYEYLWLARSRGEKTPPLLMARAITKPVQVLNTQSPDPVYALMSGTSDPAAWRQVKALLARYIMFRQTGTDADRVAREKLNLDLLHWLEPQDRQFQLGRTTQFFFDRAAGDELTLRLGLDIYNASDDTPAQNALAWSTMPAPWTFRPQSQVLPALGMFQITRPTLEANMKANRLGTAAAGTTPQPVEWAFTNGFTRKTYPMRAVIPVAPIDRRTKPLAIDGSLGEWDAADTIQHGPLVKMIDRPTLQRQRIEFAGSETRLYAAWAEENLYVAFRLGGVSRAAYGAAQNFVSYQFRRAWGEDLCELLIQPQYADNTLGPVMHIAAKTTGGLWVEKKLDPRIHAEPWTNIEGTPIRYAKTVGDDGLWRGELAIPWKAILDEGRSRPVLLRFNVVHHTGATGESATWAGPVDHGRDDHFTGVLYVRDLDLLDHRPMRPTVSEGRR